MNMPMGKDDIEESLHSHVTRKISNSSLRDLGYNDDKEEAAIPTSVDLGYGDNDEIPKVKVAKAAPIKPNKRGSASGRNAFSIYGDIDVLANTEGLGWSDSDSVYSESEYEEDMEDSEEDDEGYLSGEDPADFVRNMVKTQPPTKARAPRRISRDCNSEQKMPPRGAHPVQGNQFAAPVGAASRQQRRLDSTSTGCSRPGSLRPATTVDQKPAARRITLDNTASLTCEEKRKTIRRIISIDHTAHGGQVRPAVKRVSRRNTASRGGGGSAGATARKASLSPIPPPIRRTSGMPHHHHGGDNPSSSTGTGAMMVRPSPARRTTMDHCRDRTTDSDAPAPPRPSLSRSTMVVAGSPDSKTGRRLTMDLHSPSMTKDCGAVRRVTSMDLSTATPGGTMSSPPRRRRRDHSPAVRRTSNYSGRAA